MVNEKLLESGRFNDLVDFFHGKKLHRPALELLKRFGMPEGDDREGPETLHGPQRTVGYLMNLPPEMIDLILEFAEWPIRKDPTLGMEIFLADTDNAERLPRDRVMNFLQDIDLDLMIKYLEHIISELNDLTPEFHNRLVSAYFQRLKSNQDRDSETWTKLMDRMIAFLKSSQQYFLSKAFGLIPRDGKARDHSERGLANDVSDPYFYEAQAVILSNMEQHKQALEIYVFKIMDYKKAEECVNLIVRSMHWLMGELQILQSNPPQQSRSISRLAPAIPTSNSQCDRLRRRPSFDIPHFTVPLPHTSTSTYTKLATSTRTSVQAWLTSSRILHTKYYTHDFASRRTGILLSRPHKSCQFYCERISCRLRITEERSGGSTSSPPSW